MIISAECNGVRVSYYPQNCSVCSNSKLYANSIPELMHLLKSYQYTAVWIFLEKECPFLTLEPFL